MDKFTAAANIAFFLLDKTGSVLGQWSGNLTAKEQRELFGVFLGKGKLYINGTKETVEHVVKTGFGGDFESTYQATFNTLEQAADERSVMFDAAQGFLPTWDGAKAYTMGYV